MFVVYRCKLLTAGPGCTVYRQYDLFNTKQITIPPIIKLY